jgi:Putative zinc-binding metallo-peptidase
MTFESEPQPLTEPAPVAPAEHVRSERASSTFVESLTEDEIPTDVLGKRICDFDLRIEGRALEKLIERFTAEIQARGFTRIHPSFYLTDCWGVPEGTVAIGIPFYLADEQLRRVQGLRGGMVEGESDEEILRYLRHEMGHVVNYAYRLYATEEWTQLFGPMSRPYTEEYRVLPFSTDFVRHLPGGYAQKHPDEDWAETFAVWMTPGSDWRELYGDSAGALKKLEYCQRMMAEIKDREPDVTNAQIDYDTREMRTTVQEYYEKFEIASTTIPRSLDGDLRVIFARRGTETSGEEPLRVGDASLLLRRQQDSLANSVYRWTGLDPDILKQLIAHLVRRAKSLGITYPLKERDAILVELSGFLSTLAMNYIYKGKFIVS